MNGAETKLVKGKAVENPSAAGTAANVAGGIGIGLLYHNPVIGAALTVPKLGRVAYKAYNKWKSNPDTAFATLIRAGRTRGNTTRPTYSPEVTAPEPYSPTPRGMSGGQPSPVVDPLIGRPVTGGTEVVPRGMSGGQPSPLPQTLVPDGPMTKGSPTSTISTGTAPAEAPYQGIAEPFGKEILDNQNGGLSLKQQVKEAGGGKKGVADVAKKLGVPAVVLATWLLADEDKKKELAMLPAFAVFGMLREVKNPNYVGGKTVTISTNPGRAEIYRFLNDTKKAQLETGWTQHPFAGDNSLRYIIDEKTGDIHFAPADIMTHDMIADSTGVKDIAYRGFVKTPATLDSMFNDPWIKDATKGKFGGKIKEKIDQLKLKFDKEVSNG
jgi:hypothetical protein